MPKPLIRVVAPLLIFGLLSNPLWAYANFEQGLFFQKIRNVPSDKALISTRALSLRSLMETQELCNPMPRTSVLKRINVDKPATLQTDSKTRRAWSLRMAAAFGSLRWVGSLTEVLEFFGLAQEIHATGFKEGVGSIFEQPITFRAYDGQAAGADSDLQTALKALADFIEEYHEISSMGKRGTLSEPRAGLFYEKRYQLALQLYTLPGFRPRLDAQLERLGIAFASTPELRVNQILYSGLPAWLADHGLLLQIGFPRIESTTHFQPGSDQLPILERWTVYRVAKVERNAIPLWGRMIEADELTIPGVYLFHNQKMAFSDGPEVMDGMTIYQNVALFEEGFAESFAAGKRSYSKPDPKIVAIQAVEWELAAERVPFFRDNPLEFSHYRMAANEMANPLPDAARSKWQRYTTRVHERQHLIDVRRGRYPFTAYEASTWTDYDQTINKADVLRESSALIAQARHAAPENRPRELLDFIALLVNSDVQRTTRLQSYNVLDLLLTHLSAQWTYYPELKVVPSRPLRAQIAGQLYRLTPESLGRAWDAVHAYRETHPNEAKMPVDVDPRTLTAAPKPEISPKKSAVDHPALLLGMTLSETDSHLPLIRSALPLKHKRSRRQWFTGVNQQKLFSLNTDAITPALFSCPRFLATVQHALYRSSFGWRWIAIHPAMRESEKGLTSWQHERVRAAIAEHFGDVRAGIARGWQLNWTTNNGQRFDPDGKLREARISVYCLYGLDDRIKELTKGKWVVDDLITYPDGKTRALYMDSGRYFRLLKEKDEAWFRKWADHERRHIEDPQATEATVQKEAPFPKGPRVKPTPKLPRSSLMGMAKKTPRPRSFSLGELIENPTLTPPPGFSRVYRLSFAGHKKNIRQFELAKLPISGKRIQIRLPETVLATSVRVTLDDASFRTLVKTFYLFDAVTAQAIGSVSIDLTDPSLPTTKVNVDNLIKAKIVSRDFSVAKLRMGTLLRYWRQHVLKLSQPQLGLLLGYTQRSAGEMISRFERGKVAPPVTRVERIMQLVEEVLPGSSHMTFKDIEGQHPVADVSQSA